jgi:hypothetical protein
MDCWRYATGSEDAKQPGLSARRILWKNLINGVLDYSQQVEPKS